MNWDRVEGKRKQFKGKVKESEASSLKTTWTGSLASAISCLASYRKLTVSRKTKPSVVSQNGKARQTDDVGTK